MLEALLGARREVILGGEPYPYIAPEERGAFKARLERAITVGLQDFESMLLTEDGKRLHVRMKVGAVREAVEGSAAGIAVFITDLSDYLRTETALRSSEARFRRAMTEFPIPVMIHAEGGRISLINRMWSELSGYSAEELPTTWDWIRKASGGDPVRSEAMTMQFNPRNHMSSDREMVVTTASGQDRVWELHARVVGELPDGRQEVISMAVDITEAKRVEKALVKSRQEAESANRAKSAFLATMSHEIRTPMNAILGMAELLCETRLTDEQKNSVNVLRHSGEALLDLINDILDLSKVEAGQLEVDHVEFELDELLDTVVDIMGIRAMEKDLYLLVHIANGCPNRVWGDPARLRQILINLVGNAIKFTEQGEVSAHVVSRLDAAGRRLFRFSVTDTGMGIPPEKRDKIFQAFTQVDSSATRKFGGTGLGLTICRRLVDLMGGRIQVESAVGRGSTFSFEIPMDVREGTRSRYEEQEFSELFNVRCLLLTVSPASEQSLQEMVESEGGYLTSCSDHDGFIHEFECRDKGESPYGLVIIDAPQPFPGMDGIDYAGHLRNRPGCKELPILVLIRGLDRRDMERAERLSVGLLNKPAKRADLMEALALLLGRDDEKVRESEANLGPSLEKAAEAPPLRILLAEDSEDNAALMDAYLRSTPHHLERVENGREALEKVKTETESFDVVLMDSQMPVLDGFSAACAIRQWERGEGRSSTLRIIALTASVDKENRRRSIECGCDSHLIKPIKRAVLIREIERFFI